MTKPVDSGPETAEQNSTRRGVVDMADARVRLKSRSRMDTSSESLTLELENIRTLLDQGLTFEASSRLTALLAAARHNPSILALARCALSSALEMQGHY